MHRLTLVWCIAIALASEKMPTPAVSRLYAGLGSIYFPFIPSVVYPPRIHMRRGIALQPHQMREEDRAMSLNLVAGIAIPSQLPTATAPYFPLGLSSTGAWVIGETTGRRPRLFSTRQAAIRFARKESRDGNFSIVHCPEGLELQALQLGRAA
jgi:hypothetical protein